VAVNLGSWFKGIFAAKIGAIVMRHQQGDLQLIPEIVHQYDTSNDTTSTVMVDTKDNALSHKKRKREEFDLTLLLKELKNEFSLFRQYIIQFSGNRNHQEGKWVTREYGSKDLPITFKEEALKMGFHENELTPAFYLESGKSMKRMYRRKHGTDPPKIASFRQGSPVNLYFESDKDIMHKAIGKHEEK
jgi:hypothetical protein